MVSSLKVQKIMEFPVTIMYTDTATISFCYWYMDKVLNEPHYIGEAIAGSGIWSVRQWVHRLRQNCVKSRIRLVFTTVRLGICLNAPGISQVIHYKPPTSVGKYFQEIVKATHDGFPAKATLYYNKTHIRTNRPGIFFDIITYCRQQHCCRKVLLDYFGYDLTPENNDSHPCYDVCEHKDQNKCKFYPLSIL